jgi:hypothetical protein
VLVEHSEIKCPSTDFGKVVEMNEPLLYSIFGSAPFSRRHSARLKHLFRRAQENGVSKSSGILSIGTPYSKVYMDVGLDINNSHLHQFQ